MAAPPPSYNQGYPPPQQGYYPPQQGYQPPPQYGYTPQQPSYAPLVNQPITIVNNSPQMAQPQHHTVVVTTSPNRQPEGVNHLLHFLITLIFFPWIIVWLILCLVEG